MNVHMVTVKDQNPDIAMRSAPVYCTGHFSGAAAAVPAPATALEEPPGAVAAAAAAEILARKAVKVSVELMALVVPPSEIAALVALTALIGLVAGELPADPAAAVGIEENDDAVGVATASNRLLSAAIRVSTSVTLPCAQSNHVAVGNGWPTGCFANGETVAPVASTNC